MTTETISDQPQSSLAVNQSINKFMQAVKDDSKFQRKNALESIKKQLNESFKLSNATLKFNSEAVKTILKATLNILNDPIEKCRELTLEIVKLVLDYSLNESLYWDNDMSGMLIMASFHRLSGKEVKETSEEIRLELYSLINQLIETKSKSNKHTFEIHFQELIAILINSFNDNYPEVKKKGCQCAKLLANNLAGSVFHMQSETLIKPLLANITHQHSRVRKDIVDCLCDVIMHGNNKSVTDVISHLAQRLFDQAHIVRQSVIKLVGTWLIDLPDRYSFQSKLIPLLLTGFIDETNEIKELTESLWWDAGIKYQKENDEDLKDKSSFLEAELANYPSEFLNRRPNLGCRELIRLNASKILPGILNDISDWVEATRIKSIELLYIMIWQAEMNTTQHLETVLQTLFKASSEKIDSIQTNIFKCSKLIGHFTDPSLSLNFTFKTIQKMTSPNYGSLNLLNGLLVGHNVFNIPYSLVIETQKLLSEVCLTLDNKVQEKIIDCCSNMMPLSKYDNQRIDEILHLNFEYLLFKTLFTILALSNDENLKQKIIKLIEIINDDSIKTRHIPSFINELKSNCDSWNDNSLEPYIFSRLINDCGLNKEIFENVIYILKTSLNPEKDAQLKSKFLLLLPEIFLSKNKPTDPDNYLNKCFDIVINNMIITNIVWKAGRTASAVRLSAVASLVLVMQSELLKEINIEQATLDNLYKIMLSTLDDENKSTRLYVCKLFQVVLINYGKRFDKDQLHKLYPELIKRLDDQLEEIRQETLLIFSFYIDCLNSNYDKVLYQAHLQVIYENLLLYLDDSNLDVQLKVFDLLKKSSILNPELMVEECEKVKSKHRNSQYCADIIKYCEKLV